MSGYGRISRAALAAALLLPLAACGGSSADDRGAHAASAGATAGGFPYTVDNCGQRTTYQAPPKRAVTMNQHVTEVMLALGLEKSMVGTSYLDDSVLPRYSAAYHRVKVLADKYPSYESLLGANPDFVYGGYASAFDEQEGRERDRLEGTGIHTRLNIEYCADGDVTMRLLDREIREIGRTFGVPDRAEALIARNHRKLAATAERLKGREPVSVFVYDNGDTAATTAGGKGIGDDIIHRAGGENVFGDLDKTFGEVSWEKVVEREPDVIVIYDYGGTSVAAKKKRLLGDPALVDVPAIRNERFAVMPLSSVVLGVRPPDAVGDLARQLHPAAFE